MTNGKWEREEDRRDAIIWRSKKNPNITLEAHKIDDVEVEELHGVWYVFPAKGGMSIPSSPELVKTKTDARKELSRLKKVI